MIPFLVRKSFLIEFWIDYIVAPGFLFVNTIFIFFIYYFIIVLFRYIFLTILQFKKFTSL